MAMTDEQAAEIIAENPELWYEYALENVWLTELLGKDEGLLILHGGNHAR